MKTDYKYLFKNIGLLTISQFGTKLLVFFLVPLYTSILTTEEYGIFDLFNTTIALLIPILTLNIMDSVIRFALDKDSDPACILSMSLQVFFKGILFFIFLLIINRFFHIIPVINHYIPVLVWMFLVTGLYQIISNFSRGIDDVFAVSVAGVLSSAVSLTLSVLLLVAAKWGLKGYFYANIAGPAAALCYLAIRLKIWNYICFTNVASDLKRQMLSYSIPLIFNSVSWWINGASDRYVITALCGMAANGIYSVGYKIPGILNIFQTIFNQAWALSTVREFDSKDKSGFFTQTYKLYHFGMSIICSLIIVFTRLIAAILYAKDFYQAWAYVPFLTISIVFGALSGHIGGIFTAVKDTKAFSLSTSIGAVVNLLLNFILVSAFGPLGAAIATVFSYFLVWQIRILLVRRHIKMQLSLLHDYLTYIILLLQSILILAFDDSIGLYVILAALTGCIVFLYRKEAGSLLNHLRKRATHS